MFLGMKKHAFLLEGAIGGMAGHSGRIEAIEDLQDRGYTRAQAREIVQSGIGQGALKTMGGALGGALGGLALGGPGGAIIGGFGGMGYGAYRGYKTPREEAQRHLRIHGRARGKASRRDRALSRRLERHDIY